MDLKKVPKKMAKSIHLTIFLKINLMQKVLTIYVSVQHPTKQIYNLDICKKKWKMLQQQASKLGNSICWNWKKGKDLVETLSSMEQRKINKNVLQRSETQNSSHVIWY